MSNAKMTGVAQQKLMLTNSREIMYFLAKKFPEAGLYPKKHRKAIGTFVDSYYAAFSSIGDILYGHLSHKSPESKTF
jgi:glutathione S-transferase